MTYCLLIAPATWLEIAGPNVELPGRTVSEAWVAGLSDAERAELGFVATVETDPPTDPTLTVTGNSVTDVAGVPTRTWRTSTKLLADLKAERTAAADAYYQAVRRTPMSWDFATIAGKDDLGASTGAAGVQTLQMGDSDQANWQAVTIAASMAVQAGQGAALLPLKTTANVWVQTTNAQVLQVLATGDGTQVSAYQRAFAMLQRVGAIKLAIAKATAKAAAAAIDVTAGYPA